MPDNASKKTRARRDLRLRPETADALAAAAVITAEAVLAAQAEYGRIAPAPWRALLDAPEMPEMSE
jgi:hypothetical protein